MTSSKASSAALAPTVIRRDRDISFTDGGWFQARWHFSFDSYYDPEQMGIGTLRVFNHDTLVPGAIWPMHPHRDIEGITYVVAGTFEHSDSVGNAGVLYPGAVQRVTLGSGLMHSEMNHSKTEPMQFIQMWIMPSQRGLPPSIEQKQFTKEDRTNRLLRLVSPEGTGNPPGIAVHQHVSIYAARLEPGVSVEHHFGEGRGGYLYLIEGGMRVNSGDLATGDAMKIINAGLLRIAATEASELLLVDTPL